MRRIVKVNKRADTIAKKKALLGLTYREVAKLPEIDYKSFTKQR